MTLVRVRSDFRDYYDHELDAVGVTWRRFAGSEDRPRGAPRAVDLIHLARAGFRVPTWGRGPSHFHPDQEVVWHWNERAHRGEGKTLIPARELGPQDLAVRYLHPSLAQARDPLPPESTRVLLVGVRGFVLRYVGSSGWQSNRDPQVIWVRVPHRVAGLFRALRRIQAERAQPLVAVDLVKDPLDGALSAIDLNTAPGLTDTPVEPLVPPREIADLIRHWVRLQRARTEIQACRAELDGWARWPAFLRLGYRDEAAMAAGEQGGLPCPYCERPLAASGLSHQDPAWNGLCETEHPF